MDFQSVIVKRRDGKGNTREELRTVARAAGDGSVPDYQLSAWLMAAYLRPLDAEETAWLTLEMAASGERLDLSGLPQPWVDKHSTGGVGDKTSIVLLPLLASCGLTMVKMSGRGLGITGGTVDKLESVPGFRMNLSPDEMKAQAKEIGVAITGQTPNLAPADKALYALRDVTATVDSIPLIVSSILSKKIAGGAETVVLDVKCGSGGFMTNLRKAHELAAALLETGKRAGLGVSIEITDMSQPLGRMAGNLLEVREAAATLRGEDGRFADLCKRLAGHTLHAVGKASSEEEGLEMATSALRDGLALRKAREWFVAQGAKVDVFDPAASLPAADEEFVMKNPLGGGFLNRVDARTVGETVLMLGGGRLEKTDTIDPTVGVETLKEIGDPIEHEEPVFRVFARSTEEAEAAANHLVGALEVVREPVTAPKLILGTVS